jgi:hypothetical protein
MTPEVAALMPDSSEEMWEDIGGFFDDPLGYVFYAWDWGEKPELRIVKTPEPWASRFNSEYGLDGWACEFLEDMARAIKERGFDPDQPQTVMPIDMAVRSGHGIGKSCLVGILVSYILDTRPGSQIMVTANTGPQLSTKTWPQIKKWKSSAITSAVWRILEGRIVHVLGDQHGQCTAVTWKKELTEAFAGQHAVDATSAYINDEASAIHDSIFEVQLGGMTDGEPMRFNFGNPTRNVGEFHKMFGRRRASVITREVDARTVQITNKSLIEQWEDEYGENSDFFRVRVRGMEPKAGENQLITTEMVLKAMRSEIPKIRRDEPILMGIDVARSLLGDESVIRVRRGKDARTFGQKAFRGKDTQQIASIAAEWCDEMERIGHPVDMIFVDGGGLGAGTYDRLSHLGYPCTEVLFGGKADHPDRFKDKAGEMWKRMQAWLHSGGVLEEDTMLEEQLTKRPHDHTDDNRLYMWPKDKCKEELGIESPDRADALALTFAYHVAPKDRFGRPSGGQLEHEYDPYEKM